jgi:hypothetical protein
MWHQARAVARAQLLGARLDHRHHLVGEHRSRHITILHRERATAPTAVIQARQLHEIDPAHVA